MTNSVKKLASIVAAGACALGLVASCATQDSAQDQAAGAARLSRSQTIAMLQDKVGKAIAKAKVPGAAIAVAETDGLLWSEGFGVRDENGAPFGPDTVSNIGSVSKLFTAAAIMRLVELGKVELDAPVSRYLPDFKPRSWGPSPDGITIRGLLAHESGLQSDCLSGFSPDYSFKEAPARPNEDAVRLASETTICYKPFTIKSYSNLGYSLLGLVVEAASGKSFDTFVANELLRPIGMASSSFRYSADLEGRYARGKVKKDWIDVPVIRDWSAGSMMTSANDMVAFLTATLRSATKGLDRNEGGILSPASQQEMWRVQNEGVSRDFDTKQGLAWAIPLWSEYPGLSFYQHGGDISGFHARLIVEATTGIGVFIMVNGDDASLLPIVQEVFTAFALCERGQSVFVKPEQKKRERPTVLPLPDALSARVAGSWASPGGLTTVQLVGKRWVMNLSGQKFELVYRGNDVMGLRMRILGVVLPIKELESLTVTLEHAGGEELLMLRSDGTVAGACDRIAASSLTAAWVARLGDWEAVDPPKSSDFVRFSAMNLSTDPMSGALIVNATIQESEIPYPVGIRGDNEGFLLGHSRNLGSAIRASGLGADERLELYGMVFKRKTGK